MKPRFPFSLELILKQLEGMDRGSWTDIHALDCIPVPVHLPLTSGHWQLESYSMVYITVLYSLLLPRVRACGLNGDLR